MKLYGLMRFGLPSCPLSLGVHFISGGGLRYRVELCKPDTCWWSQTWIMRKYLWAGHLARLADSRMAKIAIDEHCTGSVRVASFVNGHSLDSVALLI